MSAHNPLENFHPVVRRWFEETFGKPSPPQAKGWPSISRGENTLILAPTGSGKTLAAFLWAINHLAEQHLGEDLLPGVRILYVSPLKALNNDIQRNLELPLAGIREEARSLGLRLPAIQTGVRTGDTPQSRRTHMLKHPPDILITTPESLYLLLTSKQARKTLTTVQYVIVDEIHSICGNKRGVHLSLSLERLAAIADQEFVRIGLSATQRPLEQIAAFLGGQRWEKKKLVPRPVTIVDAGRRKEMDLRVVCAPPDFSLLPQESVWPLIFSELLENIRRHTTTLIFVNNRRLAERVAAKLNEMISGSEDTFSLYAVPLKPRSSESPTAPVLTETNGDEVVQAYHGSMSRLSRERMEADLKAGRLRALVATSSLELGIDIGSIDLVVQLQSPKGVARGLQRVGRSGHLVTATSKGRIFPTYREDLVEAAVVARAMQNHDVEMTTIPTDCLDVLAQQIVAMVSVEDWKTDPLFDCIRQSFCYRNLSRKLFLGVVQMLAGRFTHDAFRELRARISWDKVNNTLRALPGSSQLAIMSGGTIADRGYFGVYLEDGKTKVGEVDEEFVYESRTGDTFILGTSVWRMIMIDANRITVAPAPGQPARMPFWRGDGIGRSFELGQMVGEFRRTLSGKLDSAGCLSWLQQEYPIDSSAAWNIQEYFRKQRDATGVIPHDRMIQVEGFRDEIGDPRIVVHSLFGRRVNGLLGLVLSSRLQQSLHTEPQMMYNDNGILFRCSDVTSLPLDFFDGLTVHDAEELVLQELLHSPLFGGQFRQNAGRALLMPKVAPGKRTPLWLQRLRAGDLLQVARQFDDFPIVIETLREVLHDVLDFDHFRQIVRGVEEGTIAIHTSQTEIPSPFAASLLFDFIAVYMYEWDQPRADKQSQYLAVNRELLSEIIDIKSVGSLLRPEAIVHVEQQLQHNIEGYQARSPEELLEILVRIGDLTDAELTTRCVENRTGLVHELESDGRAVRISLAGEERWIAGEEDALYQKLNNDRNAQFVLFRHLQSHGPISAYSLAQRYGLDADRVEKLLDQLPSDNQIVKGRFIPGGSDHEKQWCYRPNLERIHRQTIAILRKEITPSSLSKFTEFLLQWQHLAHGTQEHNPDGVQHCLEQLQGIPLPAELWERDFLMRRIKEYSPDSILRLTSSGGVVWVGAAGGRTRVIVRGEGSVFLPISPDEAEKGLSEPARRILQYIRHHGASFFTDIRGGSTLSLGALNHGIAELFWNGLVTNDVYGELLQVRRPARLNPEEPIERIEMIDPAHNPRKSRFMHAARRAIRQVPGWSGRWSLVHLPGVMGDDISPEQRAEQQARHLLTRYGIVAREFHKREELLPWALVAAEFQRMEMRGEIRRGYFVEGLSGMQYALPTAVESLRRIRDLRVDERPPVLVNACDPANPYGTGIQLSVAETRQENIRVSRVPGNYLLFHNGTPLLLIENFGARLWTLGESNAEILRAGLESLTAMVRFSPPLQPFKSITIEHCDGIRPALSPLEPLLRSLGFHRAMNQTMRFDGYA